MRARGAKVTDIVVLVVAADDGVMPQTRGSDRSREGGRRADRRGHRQNRQADANPERVKRELTELNLMPEEWGGTTVTVEVSAKKKQNIDLLLEMILLVTDIGELKANPKRNASGTVLEAKLDRAAGPGRDDSRSGRHVACRRHVHRRAGRWPRAGAHRRSRTAHEVCRAVDAGRGAWPRGTPAAGRRLPGAGRRGQGAAIANFRRSRSKPARSARRAAASRSSRSRRKIAEGGMKELPIIIKADVQGSAEVLADTLSKLTDERVKIRIIRFRRRRDQRIGRAARLGVQRDHHRVQRAARSQRRRDRRARERVRTIRLHSVIYNVTDEMKKAMTGLSIRPSRKYGWGFVRSATPSGPEVRNDRRLHGQRAPHHARRDTQARLLRDNVVVYEGKIGSLRRFKDDVSEVKAGFECGIGFERFNDIKVGDLIEVFAKERVAATA